MVTKALYKPCSLVSILLKYKKFDNVTSALEYAIRRFDHRCLTILIRDYALEIGSFVLDGKNALQFLLHNNKLTEDKALTIKVVLASAQFDLENVGDGRSYNDIVFVNYLAKQFLDHVLGPRASTILKPFSWKEFENLIDSSYSIHHIGWFIETLLWLQQELDEELPKTSLRPNVSELIVFRNFLIRLINALKSKSTFTNSPKLILCLQIFDSRPIIVAAIEHWEKVLAQPSLFLLNYANLISENFCSILLKSDPPIFLEALLMKKTN